MPIQKLEHKPFIYDIDTINEHGERGNIKTNLYFLGKIIKELNKGFSPMILIVGRQRMGKSYVGLLLSQMIMRAFNKENAFDPGTQCFYESEKMIAKIGESTLIPIMLDEAGASMGRREWFIQTHRALEKVIQTQGYKTLAYIFISPFASDLDKVFIKHFDFIVRVEYRGKFKVFKTVKKYDELIERKTVKYFLDEVTYNLSDLNEDKWKAYEQFSFAEKEKLRKKYGSKRKEEDQAADTVISRLKKALREAA